MVGQHSPHNLDCVCADDAGQGVRRPLYALKNDKAPGDTDGDGKLNGAWHVAAP
ncbi:MAG TPA: hypothetical protein VMM15_33305 [Bradyrhizobium sp.]|nr:hypothetical protein [Bradyrhizobium sp.]